VWKTLKWNVLDSLRWLKEQESKVYLVFDKLKCKFLAAIVCVALVNRLEGDQVRINKDLYKDFELRPFNIVTKFILDKIGMPANGINGVNGVNGIVNGTS
jgi:hypothetical protein